MREYGYIRISCKAQKEDRQLDAMIAGIIAVLSVIGAFSAFKRFK